MYRSIMVSVDQSRDLSARVRCALDLAHRFNARLIGAGSHEFIPFIPDGVSDETIIDRQKDEVMSHVKKAEGRFKHLTEGQANISCRFDIQAPAVHFIDNSRAADLLIVGSRVSSLRSMAVDPGDIIMSSGKPTLVVPQNIDWVKARHVVVAWTNTMECRRAVQDALPLLDQAEEVMVVSLGESADADGASDVTDYLRFRGLNAYTKLHPEIRADVASDLYSLCESSSADLIVAGAYGHNRMREWIFGGVTRDLLETSPVACLMAH